MYKVTTDGEGKCRIPQPIAPGAMVVVQVSVENPPHYDWLPIKKIRESNPPEAHLITEGEGHPPQVERDSVFDYTKLSIKVIGLYTLEIRFEMPKDYPGHLMIRFQITQGGSTIYSTATREWATIEAQEEDSQNISLSVSSAGV